MSAPESNWWGDNVNGTAVTIPLQHESARPLRVFRVVLNDERGPHTVEYLIGEDAILRHLVITVRGDCNFPAVDEAGDAAKKFGHVRVPFSRLFVRSGAPALRRDPVSIKGVPQAPRLS